MADILIRKAVFFPRRSTPRDKVFVEIKMLYTHVEVSACYNLTFFSFIKKRVAS
jgi:hypothetical protein